jgi:hypothetical protein
VTGALHEDAVADLLVSDGGRVRDVNGLQERLQGAEQLAGV